MPEIQLTADRAGHLTGRSPYPGLVKCSNTCYMSALLQCMVHCGPLREHLLNIPAPEPNRLCLELKDLVQQYVHGRPSEDGERMLKFDVLAPHALSATKCTGDIRHSRYSAARACTNGNIV